MRLWYIIKPLWSQHVCVTSCNSSFLQPTPHTPSTHQLNQQTSHTHFLLTSYHPLHSLPTHTHSPPTSTHHPSTHHLPHLCRRATVQRWKLYSLTMANYSCPIGMQLKIFSLHLTSYLPLSCIFLALLFCPTFLRLPHQNATSHFSLS